MKPVTVTWLDIASFDEWMSPDAARAKTPEECKTRGWLLNDPKKGEPVRIAASMAADGDVGDILVIPYGCVVRVEGGSR